MQQHSVCVFLLLLFIGKYQAQDTAAPPDWNGDPKLCTISPPVTPSPQPAPPMPKFPKRAEFALERVEIKNAPTLNFTFPSELTLTEYIYDYDANKLIIVKNKNGVIDAEYFYYDKLKKSTYVGGDYCVVSDIPVNQDMDGASAVQIAPSTEWHVRPMNEFLLFSSEDPTRRVTPVYLGTDVARGIPVHKWQSCYINKTDFRTVRRIWYFAQETVKLPGSTADNYAAPIQALISASYDFPNGTQALEFDEVFNVYSFRPGILESATALSPPKGVFCYSGPGQDLVTLKDVGVEWPNHFSVRVDASTSRSAKWQRFHIRYNQGREGESRRLRYDYMPPGSEDFESVIHDYNDNLTYTIDRRVGSCKISAGVRTSPVSAISNPILFFIIHEARFIFSPPEKAWEYNGLRPCRGNAIKCTILTTSIDNFPAIVDPDTGMTTGETWAVTNMEYGWSIRAPLATATPDRPKGFDYPVSLYLKSFRFPDPSNPSPLTIRTEDIEYEFYEMSHERYPDDFDTSLCYRSLGYPYTNLVFTLNLNKDNTIDGDKLNRRILIRETYTNLMNTMNIKYSRLADLDIDHERVSNDVSVFFTILGPTVIPGPTPTFNTNEPTVEAARDALKLAIDNGKFKFDMTLEDGSTVTFTAKSKSLVSSRHYISTHASGVVVTKESYSSGAQTAAIIVGLLIGLLAGIAAAAAIRIIRKDPMPAMPISISNPMPSINFKSRASAGVSSTASSA
ncbi:unnamed protein product [Rotaria magnacalcarata]|uniref:Uncharacterized protein n=5 Tax=Rotaria magnacalcarata TaxID=392030 RepID=A0A816BI51_9BILA|nr:unnamed protein product [Rotaria magnacalcarata]CAF1607976.1 unnamed protein product [Rotaria magnacalcarata]CAF2089257.1 unnamed protein product [Rotaria magnacalcarata]CAF2139054.1 unnamed protein product [Rotaria magnacalcarata]CAF3999702.1 unnamed protein product [Rotaria magnacalcarata]